MRPRAGPTPPDAPSTVAEMTVERHGRHWAVYDDHDELVCLTVYRKGAVEVIRRLSSANEGPGDEPGPSDSERANNAR